MNFNEAMDYINRITAKGSVYGLDVILELLRRLGNPQNQLKVIHIAGTNGKGSTLAYISTILAEAGYKTGRYVSPTIFEYLERIQINGEYMPEDAFARILTEVRKVSEEMVSEGHPHPTAFEMETAVCFMYFLEEKCDAVVLETGMGGTLDATNVLDKVLCSVITSISLDHMKFLGNTIGEIAENKAGIIVENCPVVLYSQEEEAMNVIREKARYKGAPLIETKQASEVSQSNLFEQEFSYVCRNGREYRNLKITMPGPFQINNCITAIETIQIIKEQGFQISDENVYNGCLKAKWHGRFEVVGKNPLFIVDGAHNPDAAKRLQEAIMTYLPDREIIFIMGVMADKDYTGIIEKLVPFAGKFFTVTPDNPRSLPAGELAGMISKFHNNVEVTDSVEEAVKKAIREAGSEGVVISFGSLYYAGDTIRAVQHIRERVCIIED